MYAINSFYTLVSPFLFENCIISATKKNEKRPDRLFRYSH